MASGRDFVERPFSVAGRRGRPFLRAPRLQSGPPRLARSWQQPWRPPPWLCPLPSPRAASCRLERRSLRRPTIRTRARRGLAVCALFAFGLVRHGLGGSFRRGGVTQVVAGLERLQIVVQLVDE